MSKWKKTKIGIVVIAISSVIAFLANFTTIVGITLSDWFSNSKGSSDTTVEVSQSTTSNSTKESSSTTNSLSTTETSSNLETGTTESTVDNSFSSQSTSEEVLSSETDLGSLRDLAMSGVWEVREFTDNEGYLHSGWSVSGGGSRTVKDKEYVEIPIDKKYARLVGTVFLKEKYKDTEAETKLIIYGDNTVIWESGILTRGSRSISEEFNFDLDVSNINVLKLESKFLTSRKFLRLGTEAKLLIE